MKCPACNKDLEVTMVEDLAVDVCRNGCGGTWFDWFELDKVDEKHETAGEVLEKIERDDAVEVDHEKRRTCPRDGMVMMRHFFSAKQRVEVDECPKCGGIWLDYGELTAIRNLFASDEARKMADEELFTDLFGPQLEEMEADREMKREKASRVGRMLRFVAPVK